MPIHNLTREILFDEYITNRQSPKKIAEKYDVGLNTVVRRLKKYEIDKSSRAAAPNEFTQVQKEALTGIIVGQSSLIVNKNSTNAALNVTQGSKEKNYIQYKRNLLDAFVKKSTLRQIPNKNALTFSTICHPLFTELYEFHYFDNRKIITEEILAKMTPFSLCFLLGDLASVKLDTYGKPYITLNTNRYYYDEQELLSKWLEQKFGIHTSIQKVKSSDKIYYGLHFNIEAVVKLTDIITPVLPECLKPKFNISQYRTERMSIVEKLEIRSEHRLEKYPTRLMQVQKSLFYGSSLGDGGLYKDNDSNDAYFKVGHTIAQKAYLKQKFEIAKDFVNYGWDKVEFRTKRIFDAETTIFGHFTTASHPLFTPIRNELYDVNGRKHITHDVLYNKIDDMAFMFWFCDDGSAIVSHMRTDAVVKFKGNLSTQSFSYDEHLLIQQWLRDTYDIEASPEERENSLYRLRFSTRTMDQIFEIIKPYIIPEMRYKIGEDVEKIKRRLTKGITI